LLAAFSVYLRQARLWEMNRADRHAAEAESTALQVFVPNDGPEQPVVSAPILAEPPSDADEIGDIGPRQRSAA
jgi:hypothetical protein